MESPGEYLKRERELRGVFLPKVFEVTRVPFRYLQALESDDYANLPHPTFVKGFIKTYCKFLGLDETDAVLRYELYLKEHLSPAGEAGAAKEMGLWDSGGSAKGLGGLGDFFSDNKKLIAAASAAGIAIIIIVYLVAAALWRTEDSGSSVNEAKEAADAVMAPENQVVPPAEAPGEAGERRSAVSVEAPLTDSAKAGAIEAAKKQSLAVEALDIVWIKIRIDHEEPFDVLLRKGDRVTWRANEAFSLLIGNAGGVALTYNGERLNAVGRQGEVVSIKLPKTPLRPVKKPAAP